MPEISPNAPARVLAGGGQSLEAGPPRDVADLTPVLMKRLQEIYSSLAASGTSSSKDAALAKLQEAQGLLAGDAAALSKTGDLSLTDFLAYMTSPAANALGLLHQDDLGQPLPNYYISSSHNTYLSGHQLYGKASVAPYKNVLLRGCRCIEIDVWNGDEDTPSPSKTPPAATTAAAGEHGHQKKSWFGKRNTKDDPALDDALKELALKEAEAEAGEKPKPWSASAKAEPRVLHGYTLTKEVSFRDVCCAIRDAAFVTTDLPIIVSLEVHAGLEQQEMMVDIMNTEWKGRLVNQDDSSPAAAIPTPEQLRGKILVKVKYVAEKKDSEELVPQISRASSSTSSEEMDKDKKKKKKAFLPTLSRMGVWTKACHFSAFDQPESQMPGHVFSLSETNFLGLSEAHQVSAFKHNRNFMMRIYPFGLRVSSSNMDPSVFWRGGVQMVALNWQKCDQGMMLNEAMFAETSGWVLKPKAYRGSAGEDVLAALRAARKTLHLRITLLAAQNIPIPLEDTRDKSFSPYIKCELHIESSERGRTEDGGKDKAKRSEFKRRSKTKKGVSPDFGGEIFEYKGVENVIDELSFVRFKIQDDEIGKDDLAAWACIRLDRLQQGFRMLHLYDAAGRMSRGVVLVHVSKRLS